MVLSSASSPRPPPLVNGQATDTASDDWTRPTTIDNTSDPDSAAPGFDGDELVNTNFPPPGMDPKKAAEQLAYMKEMTKKARSFYEADHLLDQEDRVTMFKAYRYQMFAQYGGAAVGMAAGIIAPKYVCQLLKKPYKPAYSTFSGLITVLVGYSLAERLAYHQNLKAYQGNSKYSAVFKAVDGYPPLIGYSYYQETVRRPESSFPDPAKFDWAKYPSFPLVLAFFGRYRTEIKGIEPGNYQTPQGYRSSKTPHTTYSQGPNVDDGTRKMPTSMELPTDSQADRAHNPPEETSWDRIRAQNQAKPFQWEPQHPTTAQQPGGVPSSAGYRPGYAGDLDKPPSDLETLDDPFAEKK